MAETDSVEIPASQIRKIEADEDANSAAKQSAVSFEKFTFKRILKESPENRLVAVEGSFLKEPTDESAAVVILEKTHFTEEELKGILTSETALQCLFNNDIYYNYLCHPPSSLNAIKATVIHPATAKHIEKHSLREPYLIEETPDIYKFVTLPHITESQFDIQWVYNILEHKKEADRIVYEDLDPINGFILLPDLKWDCRTTTNLYLTGIVCKKGIKSLRDLTPEHLPLLKNILEKGREAITEKYGLPPFQLRAYLHYQPSYYHLHIHFTSLQFNPPGGNVERSHLLTSVINNIELCATYYQEATLNFVAFEGDPLLNKYKKYLSNNGTK